MEAGGRVDLSIVDNTELRRARASEFCIVHNRKVDMSFQKLDSKFLWLFKEADGRVDFSVVDNTELRRAQVGVLY